MFLGAVEPWFLSIDDLSTVFLRFYERECEAWWECESVNLRDEERELVRFLETGLRIIFPGKTFLFLAPVLDLLYSLDSLCSAREFWSKF